MTITINHIKRENYLITAPKRNELMRKETAVKLTMVFGIIAALLAFAAALITYIKDGEIKMSLIAAGLFLLVFAFGAKNRMEQNK